MSVPKWETPIGEITNFARLPLDLLPSLAGKIRGKGMEDMAASCLVNYPYISQQYYYSHISKIDMVSSKQYAYYFIK